MAETETLPRVTAVVPAYRAADRIGATIASFLDQPDIVASIVVVVDDGCQKTAAIANSFGDRVAVLVNERNVGASASRNRGLALVETPFVHFLDADDRVEGPLIAGLARACERDAADICFGRYVVEVEGSGQRLDTPILKQARDQIFAEWLVGQAYVPPVAVLWRTAAIREIGGWSEAVSRNDDAELVLRALLRGLRFGFADGGVGVYVWHPSPHRVSKQSSRIGDMLAIIRSLIAIPDPAVAPSVVRAAAAEAAYEIARVAFEEQQSGIGRQALRMARDLGLRGHRGGKLARALAGVVGLENRMRLRGWLQTRALPGGRSTFERAITSRG